MLEKLKSRKFLLALLGVVAGGASALTGQGGTVGLVSGIVVVLVSVITYIVTEGKIDAAAVTLTTDAIQEIYDLVMGYKEGDKDE